MDLVNLVDPKDLADCPYCLNPDCTHCLSPTDLVDPVDLVVTQSTVQMVGIDYPLNPRYPGLGTGPAGRTGFPGNQVEPSSPTL